jgi:HlyD family secretion protein
MVRDHAPDARSLGIPSMKRRRVLVVVLSGALGLAVAGAIAFALRPKDEGPTYRTERLTRGDIVATVTATGSLSATNTVSIGAEIGGRVESVHVDENDQVAAGQVLVELERDTHESAVREARAQRQAAAATVRLSRVNVEDARRTAERSRALNERGLLAEESLLAADVALSRAEADLSSASAQLRVREEAVRQAETTLERTRIVSPIDGVVLSRTVEPGQTVVAALQAPELLVLAQDLKRMELRVQVDEADVGQVREGQRATFTVDAYPEREFEATIQRVSYASAEVSGVVTYEARLVVDNEELLLRPGMTATATIVTSRRTGGLLAPNAALRFEPQVVRRRFGGGPPDERAHRVEGPHVWVLRGGRPSAVPVEVLATDDRSTEIRAEGLDAGSEVIVDVLTPRARP